MSIGCLISGICQSFKKPTKRFKKAGAENNEYVAMAERFNEYPVFQVENVR